MNAPKRRGRPCKLPGTLSATQEKCLDAVASLGGQATAEQIRCALEEGGWKRTLQAVTSALAAMARLDPPAVVVTGMRRMTRGSAQRWALPAAPARTLPDDLMPWSESATLGAQFRILRHRRGKSLAVAAGLAGLSASALSDYERGVSRMSWRRAEAIAAALGTNSHRILCGGGE